MLLHRRNYLLPSVGVLLTYYSLQAMDAHAQRAGENAVKTADDAFGVTIGRESLGIYSSDSVRGFSPAAAGNTRIDGLYFDQVWSPNPRISSATTIKVGPSTQGYAFPAPTGIVDHTLKVPGASAALSMLISGDEWGGNSLEADGVLPLLPQTLSLGLGANVQRYEYQSGTDGDYHNIGASLRWTPTPTLEIVPFGVRSDGRDDEASPIYVPAGAYLPARMRRRRFDGPSWADYEGTAINYGVRASYTPNEQWQLRVGAFRSIFDDQASYANLLLDLQPDGSARRVIVADPPTKLASSSGELRLTRSIAEGSRLHQVHLSLRARERSHRYDGSAVIDLGAARPGLAVDIAKPEFEFGVQTRDHIEQQTAGIAYDLQWSQRTLLGVGLQRTFYQKRVAGAQLETSARDTLWLYNFSAAYSFTPTLAGYASYTRGLEESGTAPDIALNRGAALPAIQTRQADAGLRYSVSPGLKLIAGVFEVAKPYFTLDGVNLFRSLGDVTHRGAEVSLAGSIGADLDLVAGAVLLDARVTGPDVSNNLIGSRAVGQAKRQLQLNLDWRPPVLEQWSLDLAVRHTSAIAATPDNRVELPARTLFDVGGRYRFVMGSAQATLRLSILNLTDRYSYDLSGSGAYEIAPGRLASAYLTLDWQ